MPAFATGIAQCEICANAPMGDLRQCFVAERGRPLAPRGIALFRGCGTGLRPRKVHRTAPHRAIRELLLGAWLPKRQSAQAANLGRGLTASDRTCACGQGLGARMRGASSAQCCYPLFWRAVRPKLHQQAGPHRALLALPPSLERGCPSAKRWAAASGKCWPRPGWGRSGAHVWSRARRAQPVCKCGSATK